jgi:CRP/FNR family cyclic AMP-dependent transcriptional regulator
VTKRPKLKARAKFDPKSFLAEAGKGRALTAYEKNQTVFSQGDPADAIFYIQRGKIKLTVVSRGGKEAVVALLGAGDFFGEGMPGRPAPAHGQRQYHVRVLHHALGKTGVIRLLHDQAAFSDLLLRHLLSRNIRIEEDLEPL